MSEVLEAARRELRRGRQPIPVPLGRKKATLEGWPKLRLTEDDLAGHFSRPTNVAVLNGAPSSNQVDVDLDCSEALGPADAFLPSTQSAFGRPGKPRSHRLYTADPLPLTKPFKDTDGTMLVEVRSTGTQTVFPPSIHPNGDRLRWDADGEPGVASGDDLTVRVAKIAAASILARHWPAEGSRHDAALALAGGLLRLEWEAEDATQFIRLVAEAAGDEETRDRVASVMSTAQRLADGNPATGWPSLAQGVGDPVVSKVRKWLGTRRTHAADAAGPYLATPNGIIYCRPTRDGPVDQLLSNFTARIVEEVIADDGVQERGELVIDGRLTGGIVLPRITVPTTQFTALDWPIRKWGTQAIVSAGMGSKDRLREAIQRLSPEVPQRRVYEHPGWRELPGTGWCFLHANGAIGAEGSTTGVDVVLHGAAASILLPDLLTGKELRRAMRASLGLLELAPDIITVRLLGAVYRSVLCTFAPVDLSIFLVGPSGVYKSEVAALVMQHVGAGFDRLHLPAQWSSTPNALERICFDFKDVPVVIDDFAPVGSTTDIARLHATADRVLRAVGNRGGRGRMHADGTLRPDFPPRGLVIGTGEDAPRGHSLRARMDIVEVGPADVDLVRLTEAQAAGRNGLLVAGMAGFVHWIAANLDDVRQGIPMKLVEFRAKAHQYGSHARTPDAAANLALGWDIFLDYAVDVGVSTCNEAEDLKARVWQALGEAAAHQTQYQVSEEPAQRFVALLGSAIAGGFAHVASRTGEVPNQPEAWGWRRRSVGTGEFEWSAWQSHGDRAGWTDGEDLYVDLAAALAAVQSVGQATGSPIGVTPNTLARRLHERGFLRSTDEKNSELKVRRTLEGRRRHVLHLHASTITLEDSSQSGQSNQRDTHGEADGAVSHVDGRNRWLDADAAEPEPGQETRPIGAGSHASGRDGGVGGILDGGGDVRLDPSVATATREVDSTTEVGEWAVTLLPS